MLLLVSIKKPLLALENKKAAECKHCDGTQGVKDEDLATSPLLRITATAEEQCDARSDGGKTERGGDD